MNISWNILKLECKTSEKGLTNVVYKIYWECIATENIYFSKMNGPLEIPFTDSNNFIPYESLTKEIVINWVLDTFSPTGVQEIYDSLQKDINEQINPSVVSLNLPW